MKLLAATGFEAGTLVWNYSNNDTSEIFTRRFIESITGGKLTTRAVTGIIGTNNSSIKAYPSPDSSRKQGSVVEGEIEPTAMPTYGAEISVDLYSNSNNLSDGFLNFTIGGVDYVLSQDDTQFILYDATNTTTIAHDSGTNSTGKSSPEWEILKARVWIDSTDLYVKCVSRTNSADVVAWKITGLTFTSFDALYVSGQGSYKNMDDLSYYEVESGDLTGLTADWNTGTYDFQAHLIEVPFIAKSGADQNTKYYESVASPDWTGNTSGLPGDISDGSDITFAEAGSDKIGWELHDDTNYIAPDTIPLEDKNGNSIIGGPIHGIAVYGWRVQDDNAQELKLQVHGPTAVKKSDGTNHLIQIEQTHTDPGIIGQSGMVSHFWDFSGLTGSDGAPIDETVVPELRVSMSL